MWVQIGIQAPAARPNLESLRHAATTQARAALAHKDGFSFQVGPLSPELKPGL